MKKIIFGIIYVILIVSIIVFVFLDLSYLFNIYLGHFFRYDKIKAELRKIEYSLYFKNKEDTSLGRMEWPKTITNYVAIDKYNVRRNDKLINNFSDIFNYNINEICKKIYKIEEIKKDKSFNQFASQTLVLLNNYKPSQLKDIKGFKGYYLCGLVDIPRLMSDLFCASYYYASIKDSRTALLLAYLPILIINEIEANNIECSDAYVKMILMKHRNTACMNLLFIANNTNVDKEIAVKISKSLIELTKSEPSLLRYVEFTKEHIRYTFSKEKYNEYYHTKECPTYFIDNVCNSKEWQDIISSIYDRASEEIKNIESGKDSYGLYAWQENTQRFLSENKSFIEKDFFYQLINWKRNMALFVIANFPETFFVDFFDLYKKREEYLAISEGTAIALALAAYSSGKNEDRDSINNSMPKNMNELSKWLGVELPVDRMSKSPYQFYFADDYFLAGSPTDYKTEDSNFKNYLPYLRNKWVTNGNPSIDGNPIPDKSKGAESKVADSFEKIQKQIEGLRALQRMINDPSTFGGRQRSRINF